MSRNSCILSLLSLLAAVTLIQAIGFPTGGGGGGCCCPPCGGGGGCCISSCGCGRKKREVVTPHLKGSEVPCPQTEWRELMNEALIAGDAIGSLSAVQSALHGRFGGNKFLVNCASRDEQQQPAQSGGEGEATALSAATPSEEMPTNIHFTSSGDGYCNVVREGIWCQAIVLHA